MSHASRATVGNREYTALWLLYITVDFQVAFILKILNQTNSLGPLLIHQFVHGSCVLLCEK